MSLRIQILFRQEKFDKGNFFLSKILRCSLHFHVKLTTSMHGLCAFVGYCFFVVIVNTFLLIFGRNLLIASPESETSAFLGCVYIWLYSQLCPELRWDLDFQNCVEKRFLKVWAIHEQPVPWAAHESLFHAAFLFLDLKKPTSWSSADRHYSKRGHYSVLIVCMRADMVGGCHVFVSKTSVEIDSHLRGN